MNTSGDNLSANMGSQNNMTQGAFTSTIKGKVNGLEETIAARQEELNFYKKEIATLRSEKDTLDDTLTRKCQEIRKTLTDDVLNANNSMK